MPTFLTEHYFSLLVFLPLLFAGIAPFLPNDGKTLHRFGVAGAGALFVLSLLPWVMPDFHPVAESLVWMPGLGIRYALDADGLSSTLVILTTFLLVMATVASVTNITKRHKLYYSMVFLLATAILGVFLARDAFLFFLFWELELIPMYLLIAIWGGPRRDYAAMKFVLYTLFGSVFMVAGLLALYFHARSTGAPADSLFLYDTLQASVAQGLPLTAQILIFTGFFIPFAVKLPTVPLHTWLPDAHGEAPTPISMLLAGILLKMGAYGMLRFCFGFFPQAAAVAAPYIALLALINIVYTAGVALVQKDLKKLIAYSSVSHMGFVLLGLAALNPTGFNGATFVMVSHGVVSAALFMCVGTLYLRTHTREIAQYGGFGAQTPVIFYFFLFTAMASLGLPLLISFAGETLVFYGAFLSKAFTQIAFGAQVLPWSIQTITMLSGLGIVIGAAYLLWMLQRVFFGPLADQWKTLPDATPSEVFVLASLSLLILVYGLFPSLITQRFEASVSAISQSYEAIALSSSHPSSGVRVK